MRPSIRSAKEQMYFEVLRAKVIEFVDEDFSGDALKKSFDDAHKVAKQAARCVGKGLRSIRGPKAPQSVTTAHQSTTTKGEAAVDPFDDIFGCARRIDVADYEAHILVNGHVEEDSIPDFCAETLALAICEAKEWLADDRADEYLIECRDLPLLYVNKTGVRPYERESMAQAATMEGIGRLLTWEQICSSPGSPSTEKRCRSLVHTRIPTRRVMTKARTRERHVESSRAVRVGESSRDGARWIADGV